jgi:phosphoenolpyruvate carboxykinase (GTP)
MGIHPLISTLPQEIGLERWVKQVAELTQPDQVVWCDGSAAEYSSMTQLLVDRGTFTPLNPQKRPDSFLARTDPADVARVEERTFICSAEQIDSGPTNNWMAPVEMKQTLIPLFEGSMRGRTMYVIPFSMGPVNSPLARFGIQLTDSEYVVVNMHLMTRVTTEVFDAIRDGANWVATMHSVGAPNDNSVWPSNPEKYISHFPDTLEVWSFGSGYGGNALLGKKCMSLRIGSVLARREGWLAEHMLIMRLISPEGKKFHFSAAFPSACGKTNLAMLQPSIPGWKVETLGDDIAWIAQGPSGKLRAINPENGFFGVAPGTSVKTNPVAMELVAKQTIFTNVALTSDGDVWWEGMTKEVPEGLINWRGEAHDKTSGKPAAHPNGRFTSPARNCPTIAGDWDDPEGVELDAIIFGGRRAKDVPLVTEASSWQHGVFLGATMASEQTAAAEGPVGEVRRDPFAMLPFTGYNMADYWKHWLSFADREDVKLPKIYRVNWFLKNDEGQFVWPGFSENARVLRWIAERLDGKVEANETAIGNLPNLADIGVDELDIDEASKQQLLAWNKDAVVKDLESIQRYLGAFGERTPAELKIEAESRLSSLSPMWEQSLSAAEAMVPLVGRLYRSNGVLLSVHGRTLINRTPIQLIKAMKYARHIDGEPLDIHRALSLIKLLDRMGLGPASIDIARMLAKQKTSGQQLNEFVREELRELAQMVSIITESERDVVLYGFGRIGRLVARILIAQDGDRRGLKLRAVVVRKGAEDDLAKRAGLLRRDSVHGMFEGTISIDVERNSIIANGNEIRVIYSNDPATVDYESFGISDALLIDNTGKWRNESELSEHLKAKGISKVLLTAPGKGTLPNVVYGVNHEIINAESKIVTAASCTTNAIVPALKVLNDAFGVNHGHVETVHSFTNDQNLIDNYHKGDRRGRSAMLNMVITETGAAEAAAKALPVLAGKLTGNAIRVPTPDVSMAILNLDFAKDVTIEEINAVLKKAAQNPETRNQVDYIESPEVVSTDFVGSNRAGVIDGLATVGDGKHGVVYIWYDNENGYSHQVTRIAELMMLESRPSYPR